MGWLSDDEALKRRQREIAEKDAQDARDKQEKANREKKALKAKLDRERKNKGSGGWW